MIFGEIYTDTIVLICWLMTKFGDSTNVVKALDSIFANLLSNDFFGSCIN